MTNSHTTELKIRTGNQMIAEGAVRAGCRFFAGYPITPASGIYKGMIELLQRKGDMAISSPDEISALAYCVGASMRGFKSMTATSGPGWALMIETVQYALITETPLVIAVVQRLGPSTGSATQGAQGDVLLTEFCTSGGYTIPVLSPSTPAESYELTMTAFNWAETLRTPVIVLTDKEVAMTSELVDYRKLNEPKVMNRVEFKGTNGNGTRPPRTYDFDKLWEVPVFVPVGSQHKVTMTGSAHNKSGELKKNDAETLEVLHHLEAKIQHRRDDLSLVQLDDQAGADTLIISFGVTARAMRETVRKIRARGGKIACMNVQSLFPVPEKHILAAARGKKKVIVAEENLNGQYRTVIAPLLKNTEIIGVNKIGSMISPGEIEDAIG